jgi:hypothetical protein
MQGALQSNQGNCKTVSLCRQALVVPVDACSAALVLASVGFVICAACGLNSRPVVYFALYAFLQAI